MKKLIAGFLAAILTASSAVYAEPPEFSGGVGNEYEYEEVVFISGKPIKFTGEMAVSESEKETEKKTSYKFKLTPADKSIDGSLTRSITLVTTYKTWDGKGQTSADTTVDKYSEKIELGKDKYELKDFQFSKSDLIDNRPVSDFYSGNLKGRKYYTINKDQGTVTVDISGADTGYRNFWGDTGTNIIDMGFDYDRKIEADDGVDGQDLQWRGTARIVTSDSMMKTLRYSPNDATLSSFSGGNMRITSREMTSRYTYELPELEEGSGGIDQGDGKFMVPEDGSDKGTIELSRSMVPRLERLAVPKFRDLSGHWAQTHIEKLYSLDVLDEGGDFFTPDVAMTRAEYIKAVMKACNIRPTMEAQKSARASRRAPKEESVFDDVSISDEDYAYIKDAYNKGIVKGSQNGMFRPGAPLTRAEAVTILVRALGFESKAPTPGFASGFTDDRSIQPWAKASIYVARETGLVQGDSQGRINPEAVMKRSEASAMIIRLLEFMQRDLQRDYREDIVSFK
ncbi:S-layer domain protein [Peptoclostridium acidaminophilum DSM 3953]|uniref:S-layer domain protein n=1 Tax=Peptoclostridium acidaminophilum DSM 3953 TaxID=1286171 RepID=W8U8Y0_PEPAC|nr:S-layer homology domain-containing protein [Peptoclostridium acidaminophilum]AHM57311.1 S-layer domain protein [Peptoclostridium acidaminophilum DSM 3953]